MSNMITRQNLPAFKYFPEISEERFKAVYNLFFDSHEFLMNMPDGLIPLRKSLQIYKKYSEAYHLLDDFALENPEIEVWFVEELKQKNKIHIFDFSAKKQYLELTRWNALVSYIKGAYSICEKLMLLFSNQGLYVEGNYKLGFSKIPKLLLISDKRYNEDYHNAGKDDITDILDSMVNDIRYEVVVQSNETVGKHHFSIRRCNMNNGLTTFDCIFTDYEKHEIQDYPYVIMEIENKKGGGFVSNKSCIRDGAECPFIFTLSNGRNGRKFCKAEEWKCPRGTHREMIYAVLSALKEYLDKKESYKSSPKDNIYHDDLNVSIPKYYDKNGIVVYEYYSGKDYIATHKYNGTGHRGYEVRPHVRRSCMRYNPKTGQKDIVVKSSIVHKEKYTGFQTADRIND